MSKHQIAQTIQKELLSLNNRIDKKIIKGRSYTKEAHTHKMLLRQLHLIGQKQQRSAFFGLFSFQ